MKFKVTAEMRANFDVGTFEADSADAAMEMAQETDRYYRLSRMPNMGGVYDLKAAEDDEPANSGIKPDRVP